MCLPTGSKRYLSDCFLCISVCKGTNFTQNGDAQRTCAFYDSPSFRNVGPVLR